MPSRQGLIDEKILAERIAKAHASKNDKDHRGIMVEGLFGEDDMVRPTRGKGINIPKPGGSRLAVDHRKGKNAYMKEITGRPRTGRVLTR